MLSDGQWIGLGALLPVLLMIGLWMWSVYKGTD